MDALSEGITQGRFSYPYDHMKALRLEVTEGPGDRRDEVRVVAEVLIDDLPPHKRGTHLDVVYRYDINQILTVDVVDVESQTTRGATVDLRGTIPTERKQEAIHQVRQAVLGSQHTLVP